MRRLVIWVGIGIQIAAAQTKPAESPGNRPKTELESALALMELNRVPEAVNKLLDLNRRRPDDPAVLFALGEASAKLMQQAYSRLMRMHPDSPQAMELQARNYMARGRVDLAEPLFRKALDRDPNLPGVHLDLGRILQEQRGDMDGADREYREEVRVQPENAEAAWRLGSLLLKKGDAKEALPFLQRSDKLNPNMLDTLLDLGKAYVSMNQVEQAAQAFHRITEIDDSNELAAAAHFQLSQIYRKQGKTAEADQELKRFRELSNK